VNSFVATNTLVWSDVANLLVRSKPEVVQKRLSGKNEHCRDRGRVNGWHAQHQ
jgi:hypothetical protein